MSEERSGKRLEERLATEDVRIGCSGDLTQKRRAYNASRTCSALLMSYDEGVKFKCVRGPIGNGKSVMMCMYIVHKSQQQEVMEVRERDGLVHKVRWSKWLIVRHTFKALEETTIETWNQWFGDKTRWVTNPFEGRYEDYGPDGVLTRIDFVCLASESKNIRNDLQSLELSGAWINEAVQCPYPVVSRVFSRLKRFNPNPLSTVDLKTFHVVMDTNSPNELNWWHDVETVKQPEGWLFFVCPPAVLEERGADGSVRYVPNDVEHAERHHRRPAENVREIDGGYHRGMSYWTDMLSVLDEDDIRMLLMNQYGLNVAGMGVYSDVWNVARHRAGEEEAAYSRGLRVVGGMDLGRTPALVLGQVHPNHRAIVQNEVTTWDRKLNGGRGGLRSVDIVQFWDEYVLPVLVNEYDYPNCSLTIFVDPAGKNFNEVVSISAIQRLRNERGVNVVACDKVESMSSGEIDITHGNSSEIRIACVKSALMGDRLHVSEGCRMLNEAMAGKYCYEQVQAGVRDGILRYRDVPTKNEWSHVSDALQYFCLPIFRGAEDYARPSAANDDARFAGLCCGSIASGCL